MIIEYNDEYYNSREEEARQKARKTLRNRLMIAACTNFSDTVVLTSDEVDLLLTAIGIHERLACPEFILY